MKLRGARAGHTLVAAGLLLAAASCGAPNEIEPDELGASVVYGNDDRREPFESEDPAWLTTVVRARLLALGGRANLAGSPPALDGVPALEERYDLCEDEAFADQPSFALCTGVIVSSRWVLTAAHCLRGQTLSDWVGLRGFYVEHTGALRALEADDVHTFERVVSADDYWDYAWLELATPVVELDEITFGSVEKGDEIVSPQHGAGLPTKVTTSRIAESAAGAFWSTLDAFGGASGAPVFSTAGELVGVLTSGTADYDVTPTGCLRASLRADVPEAARERAVRVQVALDGLCEMVDTPNICAARLEETAAGCAIGALARSNGTAGLAMITLLLLAFRPTRPRARRINGSVFILSAAAQQVRRASPGVKVRRARGLARRASRPFWWYLSHVTSRTPREYAPAEWRAPLKYQLMAGPWRLPASHASASPRRPVGSQLYSGPSSTSLP